MEDESAKLWKVNTTVHEMVKDRVRYLSNLFMNSHSVPYQGFQVSDDEVNMDLQRFRDIHATSMGTVE